tara:strand:- start:232 stop:414 length:183 start_codon:yes stop_codon:yes gene_type:complete
LLGQIPGFEMLMIPATLYVDILGPIMGREVSKIAVIGKIQYDLKILLKSSVSERKTNDKA